MEDLFFHLTFALIPFVILMTLLLLPRLHMLGAFAANGEDCLLVLSWLRLGSTCARYLSYWEKVRALARGGLWLGEGSAAGASNGCSDVLAGEQGRDVVDRAVRADSSEADEVLRPWWA